MVHGELLNNVVHLKPAGRRIRQSAISAPGVPSRPTFSKNTSLSEMTMPCGRKKQWAHDWCNWCINDCVREVRGGVAALAKPLITDTCNAADSCCPPGSCRRCRPASCAACS